MLKLQKNRRVIAAVFSVDLLEPQCLLSATVLAQVPAQSVVATAATAVDLAPYFADSSIPAGDTAVNIQTNLGSIPLELTTAATPQTVANFLKYISTGEYANTIIHRSVPG